MANSTRWIAGGLQGLTYGAAGFTATDFNSLAAGSVVVAGTSLANGTALDLYADVSFVITPNATAAAGSNNYFSLYILPLNQDGTTYGDGIANGTVAPQASYLVGSCGVAASATPMKGTVRGVVLPPGTFKFALVNNTTVAMHATSAATVSYRSYGENLNG